MATDISASEFKGTALRITRSFIRGQRFWQVRGIGAAQLFDDTRSPGPAHGDSTCICAADCLGLQGVAPCSN